MVLQFEVAYCKDETRVLIYWTPADGCLFQPCVIDVTDWTKRQCERYLGEHGREVRFEGT